MVEMDWDKDKQEEKPIRISQRKISAPRGEISRTSSFVRVNTVH